MEHKKITKICRYCGKKFEPKHNNAKCCSEECRAARAAEQQAAWKRAHRDTTQRYQRKYYTKKKKTKEIVQQYSPSKLDEIAVKYDTNYGAYQIEKTLAMIPKINTDISRFKKRKEV